MKIALYLGMSKSRNFGDWWLYDIIKNDLPALKLIALNRTVPRHGVRRIIYRAWKCHTLPSPHIGILGGGTLLVPSIVDCYIALEAMHSKRYTFGSGAMSVEECEKGDLVSNALRLRLRRLYESMDRVTVRGPLSQQSVQHLGVQREVTVVGDPMLSLFQNATTIKPWDGRTVLLNVANLRDTQKFHSIPKGCDEETLYSILIEQCQARGYSVRIFYCSLEDRAISLHIAERCGIDSVIDAASPVALDQLFLEGTAVIATRLHAMIYAIVSGIPTAGLLYQDKHKDFLQSIGWNDVPASLAHLKVETLLDYCEVMWHDNITRWPILSTNIAALNSTRAQLVREICS